MKSFGTLALAWYAGLFSGVGSIKFQRNSSVVNLAVCGNASKQEPLTFQGYYETHSGRGVWKWNVALDMYQVHTSRGYCRKMGLKGSSMSYARFRAARGPTR